MILVSRCLILIAVKSSLYGWLTLGTFSTDSFEDGYGELNRAGTGMPGADRPKARENRNSLATKTIPVTTERHGYKTK